MVSDQERLAFREPSERSSRRRDELTAQGLRAVIVERSATEALARLGRQPQVRQLARIDPDTGTRSQLIAGIVIGGVHDKTGVVPYRLNGMAEVEVHRLRRVEIGKPGRSTNGGILCLVAARQVTAGFQTAAILELQVVGTAIQFAGDIAADAETRLGGGIR